MAEEEGEFIRLTHEQSMLIRANREAIQSDESESEIEEEQIASNHNVDHPENVETSPETTNEVIVVEKKIKVSHAIDKNLFEIVDSLSKNYGLQKVEYELVQDSRTLPLDPDDVAYPEQTENVEENQRLNENPSPIAQNGNEDPPETTAYPNQTQGVTQTGGSLSEKDGNPFKKQIVYEDEDWIIKIDSRAFQRYNN